MQDLRPGNYIVYDCGIRPRRIGRTTNTESTWFKVRIRRESSLVAAVAFICALQEVASLPPQTIRSSCQKSSSTDTILIHALFRQQLGTWPETLINILHGNTDLNTHSCLANNLYFNLCFYISSYTICYTSILTTLFSSLIKKIKKILSQVYSIFFKTDLNKYILKVLCNLPIKKTF